ncbi:MAG: hypothetical protein ACYDCK_06470 [Thermoplasmatota archaeon]
MKQFVLACLLATAAFALVPSAHASTTTCDPTHRVCASTYGYSYGGTDCSASPSYNFGEVYASANTPAGFAGAYVYNYCENFYGFTGSGLSAGAYSFGPAGYADAFGYWDAYAFGSYTGCYSFVGVYNNVAGFNGADPGLCAAGAPPFVLSGLP